MTFTDEQFEDYISKSLDGELNTEQQIELTREMLRNPKAHQLMDQYQANDQLAAEAIDLIVTRKASSTDQILTLTRAAERGINWSKLTTSGLAVAAAVLVMFGTWMAVQNYTGPDKLDLSSDLIISSSKPAIDKAPETKVDDDAFEEVLPWYAEQNLPLMYELVDRSDSRPIIEAPQTSWQAISRHIFDTVEEKDKQFFYLESNRKRNQANRLEKEL